MNIDEIVFRNGVITVLESRKIEDFCQIFRIILHNSSSVARMREEVEGEVRERWRGRGGDLGEGKEAEKRGKNPELDNPMKGWPPLPVSSRTYSSISYDQD